MKEKRQNLPKRSASFRKVKSIRILVTLGTLVGLAIALVLSSPVQRTSALVNDIGSKSMAQDESCDLLTPSEPTSCTDESSGRACTTNYRMPFHMDVVNPCTDPPEHVSVDGELHVVIHTTTNRNGMHMRMHTEFHGLGTIVPPSDPASTREVTYTLVSARASQAPDYTVSLVRNSGFNNSGPPPENFSDPISMQVISHGGSPNFTVHSEMHVTVNANGDTTACMTHSHESCEVITVASTTSRISLGESSRNRAF